jgi:hypothetical protein
MVLLRLAVARSLFALQTAFTFLAPDARMRLRR